MYKFNDKRETPWMKHRKKPEPKKKKKDKDSFHESKKKELASSAKVYGTTNLQKMLTAFCVLQLPGKAS